MTLRYEASAKIDHDRLIKMGGRPTRPVRLQPSWTATYKDGLIYIRSNKGELECTLSDDIDPMNHHWSTERARFLRELEQWQRFREYQRKVQHVDRLETELELENTDAGLVKVLAKLSDWQEFEVFQSLNRVDAAYFEDRCRLSFLEIREWEVTTNSSLTSSAAHDAIGPWLRQFDRSQEELEDAQKQLHWIRCQWPKVVAESVESLSETPELQTKLEAKFEKQTHAAFSAIQKLGGRPSHDISPPDESMDDLLRLLHWSSETSKYMEELLDWKKFLKWRRRNLGEDSKMRPIEYQCPQFQSVLDFSTSFENFRLFEYDLALTWLNCWQRIVRWYEEEIETTHPDVPEITPGYLEDYAEIARSHVRDSERKLADAATRLDESVKEHANAISKHGQPTGGESGIESPQKPFPPTPPPSVSGSLQSSWSSHSSRPSKSSQSPQSPERLSNHQGSLSKSQSTEKGRRQWKKKDARKRGANMDDRSTKQQTLPAFSLEPQQAEAHDDVQMVEASEARSVEVTEDLYMVDSEDAVMTDFEDTPRHTSCSSESRPITNADFERLPLSGAQGPTSRKTRSATKLDQTLSSKVSKTKGKKPTKKPKAFTEQQSLILLDAASTNSPPKEIPSLRRSERLKEKAEASDLIPQPQPMISQSPQPSEQMQPREEEPGPGKPLGPPRQKKKKPKTGPEALEPPLPPRQRKPKPQPSALEPSRITKQKKKSKTKPSTLQRLKA